MNSPTEFLAAIVLWVLAFVLLATPLKGQGLPGGGRDAITLSERTLVGTDLTAWRRSGGELLEPPTGLAGAAHVCPNTLH